MRKPSNQERVYPKSPFKVLAAGTISSGMLWAGSALAQEPTPAKSDEQARMDTVTVTARRREESLLEVPISVSVVSGDQLRQAGITRSEDLQYLVPGLSVVTFLGGANVSLRGVGTGQNVSGADESVGIYLDDIYQGVTSSAFSRFFDLERTEVLKGPQGTLYGRNVTAGAMSLVSKSPELGAFTGEADAVYGTYESIRANGALNLPIGEKAAIRLAGTIGDSRGYVRNVDTDEYLNGEDYLGLRARILVEPSENLTVDAGIQYLEDNTPSVWEPLDNEATWIGYGEVRTPKSLVFANDETLNSNLRLTLKLSDEWSLRSITGYFTQEGEHSVAGPGHIADPALGAYQLDRTEYDQFSQEVQLLWQRGESDAVVGAYYLDGENRGQRRIDFNAFGLPNFQNAVSNEETDAIAVFGEAQTPITEKIKLIAGLRYNTEERSLLVEAGNPPGLTDPASPFDGSSRFDAVTGRIGLSYQVDPDLMFFATASRGFKSGGVQDIGGMVGEFNPETLWSYEAGMKRALANGGSLEVSAFQYDYTDIQVFQVINLFDFQITNAAEARIRGIDASARLRFGDHVGVNVSGTYLDSVYEDFIYRGAGGVDFDLAGERLARSPEYTTSSQLVFDNWNVFNRWSGSANVEVNYRSSQFTTVGSPAEMERASLDELTLVNVGVDLSPTEDGTIGLFANVRNAGNEQYYEFSGGGGIIGGVLAPGRRFEIGIRKSF
jgi:iron complex outermembrane receptor protein